MTEPEPEQRAGEPSDVAAETPAAVDREPDDVPGPVRPEPGALDVPAETPVVTGELPADLDLDAQAPGWPAGTTVGQVRRAGAELAARWAGTSLTEDETHTERPLASVTPIGPATTSGGADVSAETPARPRVTDGDALLALAQDALAAEQTTHPDTAQRRRPQLTAQIDPLSGWGRQIDGELLPPTSLQAVMRTLPGRGGPLRLRPVSQADLRRFDLGRTAREVSPALRELLATLDGERCRFPGCTRHQKLHAHHVQYWSDGGPTDLANLVRREAIPEPSREGETTGLNRRGWAVRGVTLPPML